MKDLIKGEDEMTNYKLEDVVIFPQLWRWADRHPFQFMFGVWGMMLIPAMVISRFCQ